MNAKTILHTLTTPALCGIVAGVTILAGIAGMFLSFLFMASADMRDIVAGNAGFIAGALLIGAGVISLTLLSAKASEQHAKVGTGSE